MTQTYNDKGESPNLFQPTQQREMMQTEKPQASGSISSDQGTREALTEGMRRVELEPQATVQPQVTVQAQPNAQSQANPLPQATAQQQSTASPQVCSQASSSAIGSQQQVQEPQQAQAIRSQEARAQSNPQQQAATSPQKGSAQPTPPVSYQTQNVWQQGSYQQQAQPGVYQQPVYAQAPQVIYAAPPEKKSRKWIIGVVVIVCLFAFAAFCVKSCIDSVSGMSASGITAAGASGDSVAIIDIDNTIQYDGTACSPEGFKELLDRASDDPNVKALVLRVNSGGGVATAGEEMAAYLRDFKKPVVVSSASINASAAYEISSQADYIFVAKSTEIGAIGTALQLTDLSGLLDMLGVNMEVITSADSKDSSYGYRSLTDEEREYYQHMVDQINDMFLENVAEGRHMSMDEVRALATGMPFTGVDAVGNGLADEIGTLEDATDKAAELAGITDYSPYNLAFVNYDLSGLYSILGSSNNNGQSFFPKLQQ